MPTLATSRSGRATGSSSRRSASRNSRPDAMSDSESGPLGRPRTIDLNADLGEGCPNDRALLQRVSSACVCCGAHAGDPATIRETLRAAQEHGATVGAHPGYPDREGFGRRELAVSSTEVEHLILDQTASLANLAEQEGVSIL